MESQESKIFLRMMHLKDFLVSEEANSYRVDDIDRFHLVIDVIDRLPRLGSKGAYLKQQLKDKLIEHKHYVNEHGKDMLEILNWKWTKHA